MSLITISDLAYITAPRLAEMLLAQHQHAASGQEGSGQQSTIAVVDVRESDHIGGHIKSSLHYPFNQLDSLMPTLVRNLAGKQTVVFHCALSQQRGPTAALRYLRERKSAAADASASSTTSSSSKETADAAADTDAAAAKATEKATDQKVYVLSEGFVGWQEKYGTDGKLTEGYRKELFQSGF